MLNLSYSKLSTFQACPRKYRCSLDLKPLPNEAMVAGNARHDILAKFLAGEQPDGFEPKPRLDLFLRNIIQPATLIEEWFDWDLLSCSLRGRIDAVRIDRNYGVIVDWKGWPGFHDKLQLDIYFAFLTNKFPEVRTWSGYFFFMGPDYYERHDYYRDDLPQIETEIFGTADLIHQAHQKNEFLHTPSSRACSGCPFTFGCPANSDMALPCVPATLAQAEHLATRIIAASALVDAAKDALKTCMLQQDIEELVVGADRFYLSNTVAMKQGKAKKEKSVKIIVAPVAPAEPALPASSPAAVPPSLLSEVDTGNTVSASALLLPTIPLPSTPPDPCDLRVVEILKHVNALQNSKYKYYPNAKSILKALEVFTVDELKEMQTNYIAAHERIFNLNKYYNSFVPKPE